MLGLRDIHTHTVYGVDDGAQSLTDMVAMIDEAVRNRVTAVYCTSHITPGVEAFPRETYDDHFAQARAYCKSKRYPIRLFKGAEVLYTPVLRNYLTNNSLPTLGPSSHVLVEFVPNAPYSDITTAVDTLLSAGYDPILAHIERYVNLRGQKAFQLKKQFDVRYQVNCSTILNVPSGGMANMRMRRWLKGELVDYVSSDTHNTDKRPNRMLDTWKTLKELCGEDYANRVMRDPGKGEL